jgi:SAM-dependent methyltransferase
MLTEKDRTALRARFYPSYDEVVFGPVRSALERYLPVGARVLDAGAGPGTWVLRERRSKIDHWVGVDVYLPAHRLEDAFVLADVNHLPFPPGSFDCIVCYLVVEHLREPEAAFTEFFRVLRRGGILLFKTSNVRSPLVALGRLLSLPLREWLKRLVSALPGEVFPAFYRCNTAPRLDHAMTALGFQRLLLSSVDQTCEYLSFCRPAFALGLLYSRVVQAAPASGLRSTLIGVYRR